MDVTTQYIDGVKFNVAVRGHSVVCDQPLENKGTDAGISPPEFLLASLATCAGYYALEYLRTRALPTDGLAVRVHADKLKQPARLGDFRIEVEIPAIEPRHEEGVLRAVKSCLIHNTLLHTPSLEVVIHATTAAMV